MTQIDPEPDRSYGACLDCDTSLATKGDSAAHLNDTVNGGYSHRIAVRNPPREDRIQRILQSEVDDLLYDIAYKAQSLIDDDGATEAEIETAMRGLIADFTEAWREFRP